MSYHDRISAFAEDAEQMEQVYHAAVEAGESDAFKEAIDKGHASAPENLLYAAWFHRLKYAASQAKGYVIAWAWAIPLAVANGLLFWWLSDERYMVTVVRFRGGEWDVLPVVVLLAACLAAAFVLVYLFRSERELLHRKSSACPNGGNDACRLL